MLRNSLYFPFIFFTLLAACQDKKNVTSKTDERDADSLFTAETIAMNDSGIKTIHVFVALCDNKYQGIVPVPPAIGNGQDPKNNLYWGAGYGVKSFFLNKNSDWKLVFSEKNTGNNILERLLFKYKSKDVYLLADAYDGRFIKQATIDFLDASSGKNQVEIKNGDRTFFFGGASDLLAYVGHDGLMDFDLRQVFKGNADKKRETIILACYSKNYFSLHLKTSGAIPLLWSTGLMAPEAYTLHDAVHAWTENTSSDDIRLAAAKAYSKYQKCSLISAKNLLVAGW
jgi:hypothetical protein